LEIERIGVLRTQIGRRAARRVEGTGV
jgi:hypothetical protein